MRKFMLSIGFVIIYVNLNAQSRSITFGTGPSVHFTQIPNPSLTWGLQNIDNDFVKAKYLGVSFSFQYNKEFRKGYDYFATIAYDNYGQSFKNNFKRNDVLIDVDTKKSYSSLFISYGLEKKIKVKEWEVNPALGLFAFFFRQQSITLDRLVDNYTGIPYYQFRIADINESEAGLQAGVRILYPLSNKIKVGVNPVYFYSLTTLEGTKLSVNILCSVSL